MHPASTSRPNFRTVTFLYTSDGMKIVLNSEFSNKLDGILTRVDVYLHADASIEHLCGRIITSRDRSTHDEESVRSVGSGCCPTISESESGTSGTQTDGDEGQEGKYEPNTVFVRNVNFRATATDIRNMFQQAGNIVDIRIPVRNDNAPKGIAYVEFEHDAAVKNALTLDNAMLLGRSLRVMKSRRRGLANNNKRKAAGKKEEQPKLS